MNDPFKWKSLKFLPHSLFGDKTVCILPFKLNPRFTERARGVAFRDLTRDEVYTRSCGACLKLLGEGFTTGTGTIVVTVAARASPKGKV